MLLSLGVCGDLNGVPPLEPGCLAFSDGCFTRDVSDTTHGSSTPTSRMEGMMSSGSAADFELLRDALDFGEDCSLALAALSLPWVFPFPPRLSRIEGSKEGSG